MYSIGSSIAKQYSGGKGGDTTSGLTETEKKFVEGVFHLQQGCTAENTGTLGRGGQYKVAKRITKIPHRRYSRSRRISMAQAGRDCHSKRNIYPPADSDKKP